MMFPFGNSCNVDAHAKNYSLLQRGPIPVMAPLYDVLCGAVYGGIALNMSQKIAGKQRGDHIHGRHWDRMAAEIGMSAPQIRRRVRALAGKALDRLPTLAERFRLEDRWSPFVAEIAGVIESRCRRVLGNLDD